MNSLRNSVQLIGHLGKDPELKKLEDGKVLTRITLATNDTYKNNKGEKVTSTQWHNLIAWGKTAEFMEKFLTKGKEIAIQGKLMHRSYEDKEGVTRYFTEVLVNEFMLLSKSKQELPF